MRPLFASFFTHLLRIDYPQGENGRLSRSLNQRHAGLPYRCPACREEIGKRPVRHFYKYGLKLTPRGRKAALAFVLLFVLAALFLGAAHLSEAASTVIRPRGLYLGASLFPGK